MAFSIVKPSSKLRTSLIRRCVCSLSTALQYFEYGEPKTVIKKIDQNLNEPEDSQVLVKMIAAPINPADINTIQGKMEHFNCFVFVSQK